LTLLAFMKSRGLPASSTSVGPPFGAGPIVIASVWARIEPNRRTPKRSPNVTRRARICDSLSSSGWRRNGHSTASHTHAATTSATSTPSAASPALRQRGRMGRGAVAMASTRALE